MKSTEKIEAFASRHGALLLWASIAVFCVAVITVTALKYGAFGYDAIDLGIYSQVFFNSSHGALFDFSIHPHSYLGDHVELFILLLLPVYALFKSPLTLLALQTIAIALAALPLYMIARKKLPQRWSLAIVLAYLCNPFVLNLAFFEFHLLPFAIPLLLAASYYYHEKRLAPFLIVSALALTVREDVSLVVVMFGLLAMIERRRWRWILPPVIMGGMWFIAAFKLTGYWNGYDSYKFLALYSWLGQTPGDMLHNALTQPWLIIKQLVSANNVLLVAGLLVPLAGLPLLAARYLLPAAVITLQLFLATVSSTIVLQTHYASLIIPFLFIACIFSLSAILSASPRTSRLTQYAQRNRLVVLAVFGVAIAYSFLTFSPVLGGVSLLFSGKSHDASADIKKQIIAPIADDDAVVASYEFLPALAQRKHLYSLHYAFLGVLQYSDAPYTIAEPLDHAVINFQDFVTYTIQSGNVSTYRDQYRAGAGRILSLLNANRLSLASITDSVARYDRNVPPIAQLVELPNAVSQTAAAVNADQKQSPRITAWDRIAPLPDHQGLAIFPVALYWQSDAAPATDYTMELSFRTTDGETVSTDYYPIGYGIYPPYVWTMGVPVRSNHWFLVPPQCAKKPCTAEITIVSLRGYYGLDGIRSTQLDITERTAVGSPVSIPIRDK